MNEAVGRVSRKMETEFGALVSGHLILGCEIVGTK
jgi:hypothetical protein